LTVVVVDVAARSMVVVADVVVQLMVVVVDVVVQLMVAVVDGNLLEKGEIYGDAYFRCLF
jgi:hypothetical protein